LNERLIRDAGDGTKQRIRRAYELLYARPPDSTELSIGKKSVAAGGDAWTRYLQALLSAAEFWSVN
jgi:hypothetical protein